MKIKDSINKHKILIKELKNLKPVKNNNEYDLINGTISQLVINTTTLQNELEKHKPILKIAFFQQLFQKGFRNQMEADAFLSYISLEIKGDKYVVAIICMSNIPGMFDKELLIELKMTKLKVKECLKAYLPQTAYFHDIAENKIVLLLGIDGRSDKECNEFMEQLINQSYKELEDNYNIRTIFSIGSVCNDILEINRSFKEAEQALDYRITENEMPVIWYNSISKAIENVYYPMDIELRLISFAKKGNSYEVEDILKEIYKENFIRRKLSGDMIKSLLYGMKVTILRLMEQINMHEKIINIIESFEKAESANQIFELIVDAFLNLCEKVKYSNNCYDNEIVDKILEYINENYVNENMCISSLASYFKYTESYIYHLFKEKMGMTFASYLENLRLDKACRLILLTDTSINEIAAKAGYSCSRSFRRAFKRREGIAPTDYKDLKRPEKTIECFQYQCKQLI